MKTSLLFFLSLVLFTGCASRKSTADKRGMVLVEKVFDIWKDLAKKQSDASASEASFKRAELPKTFRLAVAFTHPENKGQEWRWKRSEKDHILSMLERSKKTSRVFELINTSLGLEDQKDLRTMAAQQGADALLIVRGISEVDTDLNAKALSYLAVLPMLFVEGNDVKSTFISQAVLWDLRGPAVHLGVETEGVWEMERPLLFNQRRRAVEKSKELAVRDLEAKLEREFARLSL